MAAIEPGWLLDTSILVDLLRGHTGARRWIDSLPLTARSISVVSAAELLAGCRNQTEQRALERELVSYEMLWIDQAISRAALDLFRRFVLSHAVGFLDCLIAATASTHDLRIATHNLNHFAPLPGIHATAPC